MTTFCAICYERPVDERLNGAQCCATLSCVVEYKKRRTHCAHCDRELDTARLNYYASSREDGRRRFCSYTHGLDFAVARAAERAGVSVEAYTKRTSDRVAAQIATNVEDMRKSKKWAHKSTK